MLKFLFLGLKKPLLKIKIGGDSSYKKGKTKMIYNITAPNANIYDELFTIIGDYRLKIESESCKLKTVKIKDVADDIQNHFIDIGCIVAFDEI